MAVVYNFLIPILGESGVGKSAFGTQFSVNKFFEKPYYSKPGVFTKVIEIEGHDAKIELRDIHVNDQTALFLHQVASAAVIMYSITDANSFAKIEDHINEIIQNRQKLPEAKPISLVVFGNKTDLANDRQVSPDHVEELAIRLNIPFVTGSCKNNADVMEALQKVIPKCWENRVIVNNKKGRCMIM